MKEVPSKLLGKPFSTQESITHGLSRAYLTRMVKTGVLERLSRGVYQVVDTSEISEEEYYRVATLRCGLPSAICLMSALEHYRVTDQISKQTWILVPAAKRILSKNIKLVRSRDPQWSIGIRKRKYYWITTLERTLIDCLLYKGLMGNQIGLAAIRQSLDQKKVKLGDLYDMAKRMGVEHRVRSYLEALAS